MTQNHSKTASKDPLSGVDTELDELGPSKSAQKRAMTELQALGESLLALDDSKLEQFGLSETLLDALQLARKIRAREGRRRQLQFVGKLMRKEPEETIAELRDHLQQNGRQQQQQTLIEKQANEWREKLLQSGDTALQEFIGLYPSAERNTLRTLIRACHKEQSNNAPPSNYRKLHRALRELLEQQP